MAKKNKPNPQQPVTSQPKPTPVANNIKTIPAETTTTSNEQSFWFNTRLHLIIIFVFSCLLYAQTLNYEYVQDDGIVITENMFTTQGISGIPGILSTDTFFGFFKQENNFVEGGRYRPLSQVLFAIEWQFFGKSPFIGHLGNMLFNALTAMLLYGVILLLMRRNSLQANPTHHFIALATAGIFVAHPTHVEAVANIKGLDEIMALMGALGALYIAIKAFYRESFPLWLLSGFIFFLGMMSKENTIMFLAVIPLAFYFFTNADFGKIAYYTIPSFVGAAIFVAIRTFGIGIGFGSKPPMELMNNPYIKIENGVYTFCDFGEKMATIMYTLGLYVKLLIFPHPLTHDYYPRHIDIMHFSDGGVILSLLLYVGMGVYAIIETPKKNPIAFGIWYYLATLFIISNIVFPIGTNMGERFLYMPSVGFAFIVAILLSKINLKTAAVLAACISLAFGAKTIARNPAWFSNYTLYSTDIHTSVNSAKLNNGLAGVLQNEVQIMNREEAKRDSISPLPPAVKADYQRKRDSIYKESITLLNKALQIHPNYSNAWQFMGNAYYFLKDYPKAIDGYQKAVAIYPGLEDNHKNLAIAYRDYGRYWGEMKGNFDEAKKYLDLAIKENPNDVETYRIMGVAYGALRGDNANAMASFQKMIQLKPDDAAGYYNMYIAYNVVGDKQKAQQMLTETLKRDPKFIEKQQKNPAVGSETPK